MTIKTLVEKVYTTIETEETPVLSSNLIEPTETMVKQVLELYVEGKDIWTIKTNVKKQGTNLKLSEEQIKEIINEYKNLTAQKEPEPVEE